MNHFIDAFQGWFKNGTDASTYDFRWVFAVFPVLKILIALWVSLFSGFLHRSSGIWLVPAMVFQGVAIFFSICRPYRIAAMNVYDFLIFCVTGTIFFSLSAQGFVRSHLTLALSFSPLIMVLLYLLYKLYCWLKRKLCTPGACRFCCCLRHRGNVNSLDDSLDNVAKENQAVQGGTYGATRSLP